MEHFLKDFGILFGDYLYRYNAEVVSEFQKLLETQPALQGLHSPKSQVQELSNLLQRKAQSFLNQTLISETPMAGTSSKEVQPLEKPEQLVLEKPVPFERMVLEDTCSHILKTGANKGKNCSKKPVTGKMYCRTHLPTGCCHILAAGVNKGNCCGKPISDKSISGRFCRIHISQEISDEHMFIFKNKYDRFEHGLTSLLFHESKVYGKQHPNGTVAALDDEDFECIRLYKFKLSEANQPQMQEYLTRRAKAMVPGDRP